MLKKKNSKIAHTEHSKNSIFNETSEHKNLYSILIDAYSSKASIELSDKDIKD